MKEYLELLAKMEKGIRKIAFSESEKYQFFVNEIKEIRIELADLDEENRNLVKIGEIIDRITRLQHEYDKQIKNSEELGDNSIKLGENPTSTNEVRKQNRLKLYNEIMEDLKKMPQIQIESITKIKEQWDKEKDGKLKYSEAEKEQIETLISDILLEYFIKYTKQNCKMPSELNITEYCTMEQFEQRVAERLIQAINQKDDKIRKLQLQAIIENSDVEDILSNVEIWKELTGIEVSMENEISNYHVDEQQQMVEEQVELPREEPENNQQLGKKLTVKCNVKLIKFGGREEYKTINIVLDEKGGLAVPSKYRGKLLEIEIPVEARGIATRGLYACEKLTSINITKNIEYIDREAFIDSGIKKVTFDPESMLEKIGENAFKRTAIKSITIPRNVKIISEGAFYECEELNNLEFEKDSELREIMDSAFFHCINIHNIILPEKVKKIGYNAFGIWSNTNYKGKDCNVVTIIKLNENLVHINKLAFCNRIIRNIFIPKNVETIEESAFHCSPYTIEFEEKSKIQYCDEKAFGHWGSGYRLQEAKIPRKCDCITYNLNSFPNASIIKYIKDDEELEAAKKRTKKEKNKETTINQPAITNNKGNTDNTGEGR